MGGENTFAIVQPDSACYGVSTDEAIEWNGAAGSSLPRLRRGTDTRRGGADDVPSQKRFPVEPAPLDVRLRRHLKHLKQSHDCSPISMLLLYSNSASTTGRRRSYCFSPNKNKSCRIPADVRRNQPPEGKSLFLEQIRLSLFHCCCLKLNSLLRGCLHYLKRSFAYLSDEKMLACTSFIVASKLLL